MKCIHYTVYFTNLGRGGGGLGLDPCLITVLIYYFPAFSKFIIVYIFNPRINKVIITVLYSRKTDYFMNINKLH